MLIETKEPKLSRDINSMSLVSTDRKSLDKYREEKLKAKEIQDLKSEVAELKKLILEMVKKDG